MTDDAGNLIAAYVFAGEHPIARITPTGVEYYLQDSMGSVIGAADAAGSLSASVKYDSFGEVISASGSAASSSNVGGDFRLHGMWLDEVSGLYHVRARTYDAATGRFLSRDPVVGDRRRPETSVMYAIDRNNPWVWLDPSGEFASLTEEEITVVVSAIETATGTATQFSLVKFALGGAILVGGGVGLASDDRIAVKKRDLGEEEGPRGARDFYLAKLVRGLGETMVTWGPPLALMEARAVLLMGPPHPENGHLSLAAYVNVWTRMRVRAEEAVYPGGEGPEIHGSAGSDGECPNGARYWCHYHLAGRRTASHAFYGSGQREKISNDDCLAL